MLPIIKTAIPGPQSRNIMAELAEYESPAITARQLARAQSGGIDCPIVWAKTQDMLVEDVDGNTFLDFTAGFGVASVGHAHPTLIAAGQQQLAEMPHAMGDAFPGKNKVALLKRLAQITPGNLKRSFLTNAGFEAVEVALKTAMMKTGKPGIIAFDNAYHGLGYGALAVTSYRESFRAPFLQQLNSHVYRVKYPRHSEQYATLIEKTIQDAEKTAFPIGALIIEPILGRGGMIEASLTCLQQIREITARHNVVFIVDEIFTGFGRTGDWFAIEKAGIVPDILCLGKGMNGGFPISATIGTDDVMAGWGDAKGEALHTSTFLGNPVGCAMALTCIDLLTDGIIERVNPIGDYFKNALNTLQKKYPCILNIRGRGLMLGIEFDKSTSVIALCKALLQHGFIALPCGLHGDVLGLTPPLTIQEKHIDAFIDTLDNILNNIL